MTVLLAVDLGVKTGLALYGQDGRLLWYRSQNFGTAERLRRGVRGVLDTLPHLAWLVLEGGGPLADMWRREAARRQVPVGRSVPNPGAGNCSTRANNGAVHRPKTALRSWRGVSSSGRVRGVPHLCVMTQPRRSSSGCGAPWKSDG